MLETVKLLLNNKTTRGILLILLACAIFFFARESLFITHVRNKTTKERISPAKEIRNTTISVIHKIMLPTDDGIILRNYELSLSHVKSYTCLRMFVELNILYV